MKRLTGPMPRGTSMVRTMATSRPMMKPNSVPVSAISSVVAVPESAVEFSGDSAFVHVLTDSVPAQRFDRRYVTTGISNGLLVEIKNGVKAGERVRGLQKDN